MRLADSLLTVTLLLAAAPSGSAQPATQSSSQVAAPKPCPDCAARRKDWDSQSTRTFYLKYAVQPQDMNEINAVLRLMLPQEDKTFVVPNQAALVVRAIPEDLDVALKTIDDLDRPKKSWRLTYTVSEMDGDKRVGAQHYSMVVKDGQQSVLKQGDRVPILTAAASGKDAGTTTQFVYQDVGMTFSATLDELHEGGARLRSDVSQTGLAQGQENANSKLDPVFRQSELKGEATLAPGKPLILGTMDIPGSAHHLQIEALMEPLP